MRSAKDIEVLVAPENPDLDIVFVHGLNPKEIEDHARRTWTHEDGTFWPYDLLPQRVPTARIILFAYNSCVLSKASNSPIHSHANTLLNGLLNERRKSGETHRALIFVAHSLGGLLVKQALIEARLNPFYLCIKASTYGLVFFATPHSGGNRAGIADSAAKLCSTLTGHARNSLLQTLTKNSLLNEISRDQFRFQLNDYEVLTYMETQKMSVFKKLSYLFHTSMYIVERESAKLNSPRETQLGLNRNHSDICKFSRLDDPVYQAVGSDLETMAESARSHHVQCNHDAAENHAESILRRSVPHASNIAGAPPSLIGLSGRNHWVNRFPRCEPFIGRDDLMNDICEKWNKWDSPLPRRISLSGTGSVGKTQLSRAIVDKLGERQFVIWLGAGSYQTFKDDLIAAAIDLQDEFTGPDAGNISRMVHQHQHNHGYPFFYRSDQRLNHLQEMLSVWLRNGRFDDSKVLVILDDVDGLGTSELSDLSNLISSDQVEVIYTTRDPTIADPSSHMRASNFEIAPLQPATADGLLQQCRNSTSPSITNERHNRIGLPGEEMELTSKITCSLGHLPGAVINVSHFLADNFGSAGPYAMGAYLHRWKSDDTRREILQYRRRTSRYPYTMWASYEISIRRLKRNTEMGPKGLYLCSLTLLRLLCFMNFDSFIQDDLKGLKAALEEFVISNSEKSEVRTSLEQISQDIIPVFRCITELIHVSLLSSSVGTGIMMINSLIKACVQLCRRSSLDPKFGDAAYVMTETEAVYLKRVAIKISTNWAPHSREEIRRPQSFGPSSTC